MRLIILYLLVIFMALLSTFLYPLDFCLIFILMWIFTYDEIRGIWAAFLGGLTMDFLGFSQLGSHTIVFLLAAIIFAMSLRLPILRNKVLLLLWGGLLLWGSSILLSLITIHVLTFSFSPIRVIIDALFTTAAFVFFILFVKPVENEQLKLKVG